MTNAPRFVLVHGGFHGAWCWNKVIPALHALGCEATALDLPGHGRRVDEAATLESYGKAVLRHAEPGDILVGHSMGGISITLAADAAPDRIGGLVYLASTIPVQGRSFWDSFWIDEQRERELFAGQEARDVFPVPTKEIATALFYNDCSPADIDWAHAHLTPQPLAPLQEPITLNRFWNGRIPVSYIKCGADHAHPPHLEAYTIDRLGVRPLQIDGASHSPFISQPWITALRLIEAAWQMGKPPNSHSAGRGKRATVA
jgi:pimeloyl-ACP methyl ester carboxylesterase